MALSRLVTFRHWRSKAIKRLRSKSKTDDGLIDEAAFILVAVAAAVAVAAFVIETVCWAGRKRRKAAVKIH